MRVEKIIERKENFPNEGEDYVIGKTENGKFFFSWGPDFPFMNNIPSQNVENGESGLEYFETKEQAGLSMYRTINYFRRLEMGNLSY